jgi:hypothetical protein
MLSLSQIGGGPADQKKRMPMLPGYVQDSYQSSERNSESAFANITAPLWETEFLCHLPAKFIIDKNFCQ